MRSDTALKVSDLIEQAKEKFESGYHEIALDTLLEARRACQRSDPQSDGTLYWEGLARICFAEGNFYAQQRATYPQAIAAYEETIECCRLAVFVDHFNERPGMLEEALWRIFALNARLGQSREAVAAASRALSGVGYPKVAGKPFARVRVMGTRRLMTIFSYLIRH